MSARMFKLISLNVRGINNQLRNEKRYLLGVESRKRILCSYKKLTRKKTQKRIGKMNGEVRLLWLMAVQIHVGWQSLLKKGVDCTIHSKILDPSGRYIILKAEVEDKMYV